jgi:protein ImuB
MAPEKLTLLRGPERIQAGWWQEGQCRDYYVARHEDGAECWAFVDAHDRWYLHGYFA